MTNPVDFNPAYSCSQCLKAESLGFDFTMAFQPIIDIGNRSVFGYEALVRGINGEGAGTIISQVNDSNLYRFDQSCRVKAIALAARLGIDSFLSINFLPNAVYRPELCIRTTLEASRIHDFPVERILFEITEVERVRDVAHMGNIINHYKEVGFKTALDDFGAGYAGLNMLANFQTDIIKLDMDLLRNIQNDPVRCSIVRNLVSMFADLGIKPLAEGVETIGEYRVLRDLGIELFQGYLFAKPALEALPPVQYPKE